MIRLDKLNELFRAPQLTWPRMLLALVIAIVADGLQIPFQAVPGVPEIIDVVAMLFTCFAIGFHVLLLPTFAVEFVPGVDMFPTWTSCVIAVLALRNREQHRKRANESTAAPPKLDDLRNVTPPRPKPKTPDAPARPE